jgi:alkanesulfonate monooxygenase SsuD/methylene tetrahydromethanopterin reductase-like flavin-dependent oxidoreductase (luciferase family)
MRHGVSVPCFGKGVDAALIADWAVAAEHAGWDGFFLWDHLFAFAAEPVEVVDPWIALTAAACATETIRIGTMVTPLPRRRPLVVARQSVTLDRLSHGRLVLGVGIGGGPFEWDYSGEESDPRTRADLLDEQLELLERLWSRDRRPGPAAAGALRRARERRSDLVGGGGASVALRPGRRTCVAAASDARPDRGRSVAKPGSAR